MHELKCLVHDCIYSMLVIIIAWMRHQKAYFIAYIIFYMSLNVLSKPTYHNRWEKIRTCKKTLNYVLVWKKPFSSPDNK